jgi:hypothetical protein
VNTWPSDLWALCILTNWYWNVGPGIWPLSIVRNSKLYYKTTFGKLDLFPSSSERRKKLPLQLYCSSCLGVEHNFYCVLSCYTCWTKPGVRCLWSCCYMTWVVQCLRLAFSKGPKWVDVSLFLTLGWKHPVSKTLFSNYLEFRTMVKVHKPSDSECYAPTLEPFRFYLSPLIKVQRAKMPRSQIVQPQRLQYLWHASIDRHSLQSQLPLPFSVPYNHMCCM